jgi:cytochrome b561
MGFNTPGFSPGPSPDDWAGLEARRAERTQRANNPYGREMSPRSRRALQAFFIVIAVALVALTILGILGIVEVPGVGRTPA